jgi:hypothetical protein
MLPIGQELYPRDTVLFKFTSVAISGKIKTSVTIKLNKHLAAKLKRQAKASRSQPDLVEQALTGHHV